jgi:serine/threonine-protein kinase
LRTDPPCTVQILRHELEGRRLATIPVGEPVETPVVGLQLPVGSYLLRLRAEGCAEVNYAVRIERDHHCDGRPPSLGDSAAEVGRIRLPAQDEIGKGDCFVPQGWFWSGGEPDTASSLPGRRIWLDSYVIQRDPVTLGEYLEFLNDLVVSGREEQALLHAPRERGGRTGEVGALLVAHHPGKGFALEADAEGDRWDPDWPAWMVSWHSALAYAAWKEERTGLPWRLPWEFEWEKAARGADGRRFPWGRFGDPAWACVQGWKSGRAAPSKVGSHPVDTSPYGVRGLAGGVCDWVLDPFTDEGPPVRADGLFQPAAIRPEDPSVNRCVRGGSWCNPVLWARSAMRHQRDGVDRRWVIGFRLARSTGAVS